MRGWKFVHSFLRKLDFAYLRPRIIITGKYRHADAEGPKINNARLANKKIHDQNKWTPTAK